MQFIFLRAKHFYFHFVAIESSKKIRRQISKPRASPSLLLFEPSSFQRTQRVFNARTHTCFYYHYCYCNGMNVRRQVKKIKLFQRTVSRPLSRSTDKRAISKQRYFSIQSRYTKYNSVHVKNKASWPSFMCIIIRLFVCVHVIIEHVSSVFLTPGFRNEKVPSIDFTKTKKRNSKIFLNFDIKHSY